LTAPAPGATRPTITYDDFARLDLRVARVVEAHDHPNADKLICMTIDLGTEKRQIIAGLKPWYTSQSLLGRQIAVVVNLAPRKMRGLESNGMLLAATAGEGEARTVVILVPEREVPPGAPIS
jgi:methionyl-tRNA synthetase